MRRIFFFAALAVMVLAGGTLFAQRGGRTQGETMEVKLASPLPKESPWGRTLDRVAAEWNRITGGQVRLRVLHGGTEGGEGKMLLSLTSNTIQGAGFTSFGLASIYQPIMTMSAPFLIRTTDELNAVMKEVLPDVETKFNSGDYFIVAWSKAGFVNIFSKDPVFVPDDLKKQKIATSSESSEMNTAFKTMGYQLVETDWTDLGTKVATGAIMAVYQNPAGVAAFQLHTYMKNMLSINIAPVLGGIVLNQVTWKKIGTLNPRYQDELRKVTQRIAEEFDESLQKTVNTAINTMTREGLKVNKPSPAQEQVWNSDVDRSIPMLLGTTYDRDLYQKISTILARVRAGR
ncbi:MAG: TRAP transporter substrate-binding protein DctP [Treponema sp.]|nr:TRAP transporter substrate-binding protein DctP [Treponema sp.]